MLKAQVLIGTASVVKFAKYLYLKNGEKLGGEGKFVQIDESKFGKRKYHWGHHVEGQWVFGGIEENSRKCFLVAVEKRDEAKLLPIIQKWIAPGAIIVSDCWRRSAISRNMAMSI